MENEQKYSHLIKNTALLTLSSFGSKFLSFFLVPLFTNVLSTAEYSTADIITTSGMLLMYVFTMNIGVSVLRFGIDKEEKQDKVFAYGMNVLGVGTLIVSALVFGISATKAIEWPSYCYPCLVFAFFADSLQTIMYNYLRAIDKVKTMAIAGLLETITRLITNLVTLLVFHWGLLGYLLSLVLGPLVGGIFALINVLPIQKSVKDINYEKRLHYEMRKYAVPSIFSQLAWWANNSIDKYFVLAFKGASINGVYALSYKLPGIMAMLCNVFGQAWGISAIKELDPNDKDGFFSNTYGVFNSGLILGCSVLILVNIPVSRVLYAKDFFDAWRYSSLLILGMLFSGLSTFFGGIFNAAKNNKILAGTTIMGAIVNVALNALLIPPYGAYGAAIATMLSFYSIWISRLIASRKYVKFKINIMKDHVLYILVIVQIVFEHFEDHFYIGQTAILLVIIALEFGDLKRFSVKALSFAGNRLRKR